MSSVIAWGRLLPDRVDLCMQSADVAEQRPFRHVDIEHRDEADELDRDGVSERQGVQKAEAGCVGLVIAEDDRLWPADEARQQLRGNALVGQLAQHRREQPIELVAVPRDISKGRRRTSLMSTSIAEKGRIRQCTRSRVGPLRGAPGRWCITAVSPWPSSLLTSSSAPFVASCAEIWTDAGARPEL